LSITWRPPIPVTRAYTGRHRKKQSDFSDFLGIIPDKYIRITCLRITETLFSCAVAGAIIALTNAVSGDRKAGTILTAALLMVH
jgi:hypothetical protein